MICPPRDFYPRSPCGERRKLAARDESIKFVFLSTLSLRRATVSITITITCIALFLSTLSLRRATVGQKRLRQKLAISIHALLAESDVKISKNLTDRKNFYPRSPCGERPPRGGVLHYLIPNFYPRSPCGERPALPPADGLFFLFLSTLSLRRATTWARGSRVTYVISIHALLAESDPPTMIREPATSRFLSTLSLRRATYFLT